MTYQGERVRPMATEQGRCFEVSKVRLGPDGHISDVLWAEINASSDQKAGVVVVSVADVVDAIHDGAQVAAVFPAGKVKLPERVFVIVEHEHGREGIGFDDPPSPGRNLADLGTLDDRSGVIAFHVSDMTNTRCAGAVTKALKAIDHAALVRVDMTTFTVEVESGSATPRQLSEAIRRAGYSPVAA